MTTPLEARRAEGKTVLGSGLLILVIAAVLAALWFGWLGAALVAMGVAGGLIAMVGYSAMRETV
jgi:hypothetical protein